MISPEFIEMCRAAEEIQEQWEPKEGDKIINLTKEKHPALDPVEMLKNMECCKREVVYKNVKEWGIWLPRIEDLVEIAREIHGFSIKQLGLNYHRWLKGDYSDLADSWLEYVMESCYGKQWKSEEKSWVEI